MSEKLCKYINSYKINIQIPHFVTDFIYLNLSEFLTNKNIVQVMFGRTEFRFCQKWVIRSFLTESELCPPGPSDKELVEMEG